VAGRRWGDMHTVTDELRLAGFRPAGSVVRDLNRTVRVQFDWEVQGFVLYAMVVNGEIKKFGTTGRKASSFTKRMHSTFQALRQVIEGSRPGKPVARWRTRQLDPFKAHAPKAITAGYQIDLWATECPTAHVMMARETDLNNRYVPEWTKEGRRARASGATVDERQAD
jgi:hypothetical protein